MRRLIIKPNPNPTDANPAKYHTHLRLEDGSEPRLKLAGFSYFGEIGGHRHIPVEPVPLLYPDRNTPNWEDVIQPRNEAVRATYAQWLALLAAKKVNLARVWAFDLNEADSYPFFHTFNSEQYNLDLPSSRYLRRLVRFIDIARKHGIVVHITLSSDQMMRPVYWGFMPFHPEHALPDPATGGEYFTTDGRASLLGITDGTPEAQKRRRIEREMVRALVNAVKPYWNVMFEIMNEAGVTTAASLLRPWHIEVAKWLDEDLNDGTGKRTHLVTVSTTDNVRASILGGLVVNGENLVDIVSLHGNQWGGNDALGDPAQTDQQITEDTRAKVRALYDAFPNRPFAVICDSDALPKAQHDPQRYARIAFSLQLNYAHRWHEDFLTQGPLLQQLTQLAASIPAGISTPDAGPRPAPIPTVTFEESAVAGSWVQRPGVAATDIGAYRRDSVWVVSNTPVNGGFTIHRWNGSSWSGIDGGAVRIAVGPDGLPWVVNNNNRIFRRTGSGWVNVPGSARDIGVGGDGSVWIVGTTPSFGGFEILRRVNDAWVKVDGGAVRITVNPVGEPWVVNDANQVFARDGNAWIPVPGPAVDIAVGLDDTLWILGTNAAPNGTGLHYWLGTEFRGIDGGGTAIAVDHDGLPWVTNNVGAVYQRRSPE